MSRTTTATGPAAGVLLPGAAALALVGAAGAVLVVALLTATGADTPTTLGDPGPGTTIGLPLARYAQDLLGVLVVGAALIGALATPPGDGAVRVRATALLGPLATAWAVVTVLVYQLTASDLSGRPLPAVLTPEVQAAFLTLPQARAHLLVLAAAVVLVLSVQLRDVPGLGIPAGRLLLATAALVPPTFVGHSAAAEDHELAVASVSVHLVAGAMWVGGLALLTVLVLADRRVDPDGALPVVRAFSTLALGCVIVIGASGVLNASLRVDGVAELVGTPYGLLLLGKAAALSLLVGFGWWHRRVSIASLADGGGRRAFVRLASVELAVMALTVAAAVVLARTPPPI